MQQLTREQIISVCQAEPETFTDAYLALKTEVAELRAELQAVKDRLAQDSHNKYSTKINLIFLRSVVGDDFIDVLN